MFIVDGLAWDWVNGKMYWTDACQDEIEVYDPVTGYRSKLTGTGSYPYAIIVDPATGYVLVFVFILWSVEHQLVSKIMLSWLP